MAGSVTNQPIRRSSAWPDDVFVGPKGGQGIGQPAYIRLKPDGSVEIAPPIVRGGVDDLPLPSGEMPLE